jgi:Na+/H+ antiporter NhaC
VNLLELWRRCAIFSIDGASGVKNFKYVCYGFLCCVCGLISLEFLALFMVFNVWIGGGFIFESYGSFLIFQ